MTFFPQFATLPLELQREIWQKILDEEPEPAVHIFRWDGNENHRHLPELMEVEMNPLMHVCHESRGMARKQLNFHHVLSDGTCLGPYREFRPDLDAIYVSSRDWSLFFFDNFLDNWREQAATLQHLALDARVVGAIGGVQDFAQHLDRFGALRSVSIVFSEEGWVPRDHVPTGSIQYRLVDCAEGQTVWNAPAGEVKRRDMDPWEVIQSFKQVLTIVGVGEHLSVNPAPVDEMRADESFRFDIIPQNIVPKGRKHSHEKHSTLLLSIISSVRGLLS